MKMIITMIINTTTITTKIQILAKIKIKTNLVIIASTILNIFQASTTSNNRGMMSSLTDNSE